MGTQNTGFRTTGDLESLENTRFASQVKIDAEKTIEERRKYGQFPTPYPLAKEIVEFGLNLLNSNNITFLEPCIGTGVFYSALLSHIQEGYILNKATGIELDAMYYECAKKVWGEAGLDIVNDNFTFASPNGQYNLVLTNPPYVRHHYLSQEEKISLAKKVDEETGIALSGLAGLYCHFMLLTHKWLAPNAVCGWLVPSEFMDVNYGSALKDYLLNHVHLIRIHRYDPNQSMFSNALVSSCVVWFKNEIATGDYGVEFTFGGTHDNPLQRRIVKKSVLQYERKWTRFPEKDIRDVEVHSMTLGDYFTIKRGLATGDNEFFILKRDKIAELKLDMSFFKPILPSPRFLKTDFVESDDSGIPQIEPQYFLLDCGLDENEIERCYPAIWDYLQSGKELTSKKYLCKSRKKWYWQERRQATYFLCSYMGRGNTNTSPFRFILNLSEAIATNSYLMLYPKDNLQQAISKNPDLIFRIWEQLKSISGTAIEEEGRVYGGGLRKIEPRELAKIPCADLIDICVV